VPELRKIGEQDAGDAGSHRRNGLQEVLEGRSVGVFEEDGIDLLIERLHVLLEGAQQRGDEAPDPGRRDIQPVLLGYDQGQELAPARDQIGQ
jgi:hypothetical protein